jgi:hypothetical protein
MPRKKALTDALRGAGIDIKAQQTDQQARMRAAITQLLHNAQRANAVRYDVDLPDVLALLRGASMAAETGDYPQPVLAWYEARVQGRRSSRISE